MKNKKIIIIGAGGFAAVVAETAILAGHEIIGFADDNKAIKTKIFNEYQVISTIEDLIKGKNFGFDHFIIAIGHNETRKQFFLQLIKKHSSTSIIHPNAIISASAKIGIGNIILAGTVINANSIIGKNNIINSLVLIDHDSQINNHCHIAQGTIIGSNVVINDKTLTGIGKAIPSFSNVN